RRPRHRHGGNRNAAFSALTSFRGAHEVASPESITTDSAKYAPTVIMDSGLFAEPVIGPATSGRTRWLSPGMTKSHRGGDPLLELLLRRGADLARGQFAVLEQHQRRDRHDAEFGRRARVLVDIELDDLDLTVERLGNLFQRRRDHTAGAATFRPV